jgi:glycosyltransferase involved in cell wall biosynthesis
MPPTVTVLTAVRNGARFLDDTIRSVQEQTFADWEYLLVDDASEDDTVQIIETAAARDPRIRLIRRSERGGPYVAANVGLAEAKGRYVVRLDADDLALPRRIDRQLAYLGRTGLRACASLWRRQMDTGEISEGLRDANWGVRALKWRLGVRPQFVHSTACIERGALEDIGGYRELPVSQDLRMWCEFARRDWLGVVPEILVHFRRPGHLTTSSGEAQERLALDILREHLEMVGHEPWTDEEVRALRPGWKGIPVGVRVSALRRWTRMWRADATLDAGERRELARLARAIRWHVTRQAFRREGMSIATVRGTLSGSRRPLRSGAP